jgi:SAM-dependent methyltransferase
VTADRPEDGRLPGEVLEYYQQGREAARLSEVNQLEFVRTQAILSARLPASPAVILDVGGGPGAYACWLATRGYEVHLIDPVPLHVAQALEASGRQPKHPLGSALLGDARDLAHPRQSADVVLLLGPLYHLTDRADRVRALREVHRVLRPGGILFAVGISRFASLLDGLAAGSLRDPEFARLVKRDLRDGQHRNPTKHPGWFTTAFLHHPDELAAEVAEAGHRVREVLGVEGPPGVSADAWRHFDEADRARLLGFLELVEREPSLLGSSPHLMVVAQREPGEN